MKRGAAAAAAPRAVVSSSPGRAEKLPAAPGLARLLRGKSGSRSRGRGSLARSSPMFVSRSRSVGPSAAAPAEEGEPSSPKVTCIGQVRIRAKKNKSKSTGSKKFPAGQQQNRPVTMRCRCLERALLCQIFSRKPSSGRPRQSLWRRWTSSLRSGRESSYQQRKAIGREADAAYPPPRAAARGFNSDLEDGYEDESEEAEEEEEETRVFMPSATTTPPKNALLLMRCRSAPHNRSSFLATRFSASPIPAATESPAGDEPGKPKEASVDEEKSRGSCNGSTTGAGDGSTASASAASGCSSPSPSRPLVLTRCKSEPARTAARLVVPEDPADRIWNNNSSGGRRTRLALVHEEGPEGPTPSLLPC